MKKIAIFAISALFALPLINSCKKGANDPALTLKGRNSRLSAEWTVIGGSMTMTNSSHDVYTYSDNDCGSDYDETFTFTNTTTFGSGTLTQVNSATTTASGMGDWAKSQGLNCTITLTDYKFTIRADGTYTVSIVYSYDETKYPLGGVNDEEGMLFTGTYTVDGTWRWIDSEKNRDAILFSSFPMFSITKAVAYDNTGDFDYTYVDGISINEETDMIVDIDQLKSKEMILTGSYNRVENNSTLTDEFEVYGYPTNYDCIDTESST
ncbi:MAG: hypothetical protein KKA07_02795, partial [Bacteroidetes bacterium]|nr:hypothetical protein [Bacteroidota bacterium]